VARRRKSSPAEDFMDLVSVMPWWAGVALALTSYVVLHGLVQPSTVPVANPRDWVGW
jgi:restriction system protein